MRKVCQLLNRFREQIWLSTKDPLGLRSSARLKNDIKKAGNIIRNLMESSPADVSILFMAKMGSGAIDRMSYYFRTKISWNFSSRLLERYI